MSDMMYSQEAVAAMFGISPSRLRTICHEARSSGVVFNGVIREGSFPRRLLYSDTFIQQFAAYSHKTPRASSEMFTDDDCPQAKITGITPSHCRLDPQDILAKVLLEQERAEQLIQRRYNQEVFINDTKPFAVAFISDIHFGSSKTNYRAVFKDADIIRDTPGMYAALLGDSVDNWVKAETMFLQRNQQMSHEQELSLLRHYLEQVEQKLVAVVSGNHENRTYLLSGIDLLQTLLDSKSLLYDRDELLFSLKSESGQEWKFKLRHKWGGKSVYNPTHAIEKDSKLNDTAWQFGVQGHTHYGVVFREFYDHAHSGKKKLAIQLGCYEMDSDYARELNCPKNNLQNSGSGAIVFFPDGRWQAFSDLEVAAEFLAVQRGKY
jgi:hypothetical protein